MRFVEARRSFWRGKGSTKRQQMIYEVTWEVSQEVTKGVTWEVMTWEVTQRVTQEMTWEVT